MQLSQYFELTQFRVSATAARRGITHESTPEIIDNESTPLLSARLTQGYTIYEPGRIHV
jgi:hypothetical protein